VAADPVAASGWAPSTPTRAGTWLRVGVLAGSLTAAVEGRVALNGSSTGSALLAGALFALALAGLAALWGWRFRRPDPRALAIGGMGGIVTVGVATAFHGAAPIGMRPEPLAAWAGVTVLVAMAEELAIRGALLDAARAAVGPVAAIALTSVAFGLVHVPLYGWSVVPLDVGVGILFAGLRLATGSVAAPALAHALADLATWWL
jgi:membrane protease YdiL (CAAX protease family)